MSGKWSPRLTAEALEQLSDEEFWGYVHEWASFTPPAPSPEEYLKCELSSGDCLISLMALYEVMPCPQHFALLPATPAWMVGIFAWRGETIAVIDLDAYLSTPVSETDLDPTLAHDPEAGYDPGGDQPHSREHKLHPVPTCPPDRVPQGREQAKGGITCPPDRAPCLGGRYPVPLTCPPDRVPYTGEGRADPSYGRGDHVTCWILPAPQAGSPHSTDKSALYCGRPDQLLIANCAGLPVGLLVPTRGVTTTQSEASVLDIPAILMDIVQRIGEGTHLA